MLDGQGNIAGHGTDPTGKVGDIAALAKAVIKDFSLKLIGILLPNFLPQVPFAEAYKKGGVAWHKFNEECRALRVTCDHNSEWRGRVHFTFYDGEQ